MEQEQKPHFFRSRYLVDPHFFFWFVRVMVTAALSVGVLLGMLFWWYHQHVVQTLDRHGWLANRLIQEEVATYGQNLLLVCGLAFVIIIVFLVFLGLVLAHRISGPLHKLKIHVDKALQGEKVNPLAFRKRDHFHSIADRVNKLLAQADLLEQDQKSH